ncbi:Uncharacterized protein Fot_39854 [Forsythia ovata]|uniref:Bulb-type lectin domain-containing protein n=1 Tax=Forsythia ovata TaxID=205694 RepID=A0ABD1S5V5_9LAMI
MAQSLLTIILAALLYYLTFLKFTIASDTLSANQTIRDGQTLVSEGQIFELGFFSPGRSKDRFLGIWYKPTPEIVVWVANRNQPITDSQGILTISRNGTLVLSRGERIIWSSNLSSVASSPVMQLLQTGNLVLVGQDKWNFRQIHMAKFRIIRVIQGCQECRLYTTLETVKINICNLGEVLMIHPLEILPTGLNIVAA